MLARLAPALVLSLFFAAAADAADPPAAHGAAGKKSEESLDQLLGAGQGDEGATAEQGAEGKRSEPTTSPPPAPGTPAAGAGAEPRKVAAAGSEKAGEAKPTVPAPTAAPAASPAVAPPPPATDDNDATREAAPPTALTPVPPAPSRSRGPYELGPLDCRVLDGAGIERVLPPRLVAGEEPDVLCRIVVTQPPTVASEAHQLTLSVAVGGEETYKQVRKVRMSAIGRRALVFVVPADRISSDDGATVKVRATLSPPTLPAGGRSVSFAVEVAD